MEKLMDKETGAVLGWQCQYEEVVGKTVEIQAWTSVYSEKFTGQQVYLYCKTPKGEDLVVTTFSFYVLGWCLHHMQALPLMVQFTKRENAQVIKTVKGGKAGASTNEKASKG